MSAKAKSELTEVAACLLWPLKMLGWWATVMLWPCAGLLGFGADLGTPYSSGQRFTAWIVFVLWLPFFFGLLLPTYRWLKDSSAAYSSGTSLPRWGQRSGTVVHQFYEDANRTITSVTPTGVRLHPSEDGINDLGQTGGLPRGIVNPLGYQSIAVGPWWSRPHCENCQASLYGDHRCRHCGVYLLSSGRVDHEAQQTLS